MSGSTYSWRPRAQIAVDAQAAGEEIEALRERVGGTLTPAELVSHARISNAVLHGAFDWEDDKAADKWRLEQARHILGSLIVSVTVRETEAPRPMRAFVNVVRREQQGYVSLAVAMGDAELRAQIVERAWAELMQWQQRYSEYAELARMSSLIAEESPKRSS